jgi:magnesium transporter
VPDDVYQQRGDGWVRTDAIPSTDRSVPTWVMVGQLTDLPAAARAWGLDDHTVAMLEHRVETLTSADSPRTAYAHVDRSPAGDLLMSTPTSWYDEATRDVYTGEVTTVACPDLVLTAEAGSARALERAAERLVEGVPTPDDGTREVLAALLFTVLSQASEVELGLGEAVQATERLVFSHTPTDPVQRIYDLKREIAEARRALSPLMAALPEFEAQADDDRDQRRAWTWLDNVQATVDRLDRHLVGHDELLRDMLSAHLAQVSVRQNEDMRKISAWAAMITVPTLIAGIYGMNFQHMPELAWTVGYPLVLGLMAGICAVLYRAFRRSGWL